MIICIEEFAFQESIMCCRVVPSVEEVEVVVGALGASNDVEPDELVRDCASAK